MYCTWYRHAFAFRCARFSRRRKLYRAGSRAPSFASAVHTRVTRRIQNGPNQAVSDPSSRVPLFAGLGTASARVAPGLPGARASRPKAPDACILGFHPPGHRLTSALTPLLPQCHRHESDRPHRLPRSGTYSEHAPSRGRRTRRAGHSRTTNLSPARRVSPGDGPSHHHHPARRTGAVAHPLSPPPSRHRSPRFASSSSTTKTARSCVT